MNIKLPRVIASCRRLLCSPALLFALLTAVTVLTPATLHAAAAPKKVQFDVPAEAAEQALKQFSAQSGVEVLFSSEITSKVRTNAVKGEMSIREAMDRLLAGTSLLAVLDERTGAFAIKVRPASPASEPSTKKNDSSTDSGLTREQLATISTAGAAGARGGGRQDEVIELSPFQVTAEEDDGYKALSTLGGTRLRTDLRDLAASISVVTKELMNDLAANTMWEMANYTMDTEVEGIGGNVSGAYPSAGTFTDFSGTVRQVQPPIRVRGLALASRTRDYFLTDLPEDGYNMDRIEIQRGPNGMLYGLGSPAGVINQVMSKANVQRNRTQIGTRFGSYGSYRASLDHNQVLVKDKLALRLASLYNHNEYQIEEASDTDRRAYATLTYKPFKDTTVRVSGETALIRGTPPQYRPPIDAFSYWWDIGKPVYNAATQTFSFLGTPPAAGGGITGLPQQFLVNFQHRAPNPSVIVEDPNSPVYGLSIPGHPQAAELASNRYFRNAANTGWVNGAIYSTSRADNYQKAINSGLGSTVTAFWRTPTITDPEIFDFFHHQLDGTSRNRAAKWGTYNIAVEQRLGRNAGIELAYDRQDYHTRYRDYTQFNRYTLNLDVTTVLLDGNPNPNFGRPFMADANFTGSIATVRDALRITAYYDFDTKRIFREGSLLARIFGRHTLTGNYTTQTHRNTSYSGNLMLDMNYYNIVQASNAGTATIANVRANGQRQVNVVTYLGPNLAGTTSPQNQGIQGLTVNANTIDAGLTSLSLYYHPVPPASTTVPTAYTTGQFSIAQPSEWDVSSIAGGGSKTKSTFNAISAVVQDRWFENTLISTLGIRRDWIHTYDAGSPLFNASGVLLSSDADWGLKPVLNQRHDSFNYGLALHVPAFIKRYLPKGTEVGFLYNHSDNFTPQAARIDVYGNSIEPTTGRTQDYGLFISLFDRKLDLRVSRYDSASALANSSNIGSAIFDFDTTWYDTMNNLIGGQLDFLADGVTPSTAAKQAFINFIRSPEASMFYRQEVAGWTVDAAGNLVGSRGGSASNKVTATSDIVAKGWEVELTANPTRNWRITANVAKQMPVLSNSGNELWALMESWRPQLVDGAAGDLVWQPGTTNTIRNRFLSQVAVTQRGRALDGSVSPEVRKWRFNLITNYNFKTGRLKGWGVGGSMRWQDKAAIGYPVTVVAGSGVYDVKNPYFGPAEKSYDAWLSYNRRIWKDRINWRAQLNVRNIGVKNKLIPVTAQPNGSIDAYRVAADINWVLSNSFEF